MSSSFHDICLGNFHPFLNFNFYVSYCEFPSSACVFFLTCPVITLSLMSYFSLFPSYLPRLVRKISSLPVLNYLIPLRYFSSSWKFTPSPAPSASLLPSAAPHLLALDSCLLRSSGASISGQNNVFCTFPFLLQIPDTTLSYSWGQFAPLSTGDQDDSVVIARSTQVPHWMLLCTINLEADDCTFNHVDHQVT